MRTVADYVAGAGSDLEEWIEKSRSTTGKGGNLDVSEWQSNPCRGMLRAAFDTQAS